MLWDLEGKVYSWGDSRDGKLGHPSINGNFNYKVINP